MEDVLDAIRERKSIPDFCKSVSIEKIKEDKYSLLASHYLDIQEEEVKHRSYEDRHWILAEPARRNRETYYLRWQAA